MTTTVASLITEITDRLDDYGDSTTSLSAAVTDTTGTSVSFTSTAQLKAGYWALVDNEILEIMAVATPATVRRGGRGSTAATHANGAVVRVNVLFPPHRILGALNAALDAGYPSLHELVNNTSTLTVVTDQYNYSVPSTIEKLWRVEIESETNAGVYIPIRKWEMIDNDTFRIYDINSHSSGQVIKCVGTAHFTDLTLTGNLDADFPDTDHNATEYLRKKAMSLLITDVQAQIARRDSFKGITDAFQNSQPYLSLAVAKELKKEAEELLRKAKMPLPQHYTPDPGRFYLQKGE